MIQTYGVMFYTREGLPVRCWVFPGNTTDVNTVEKVRSDLRGWSLGRALFAADAGINSQDNREELGRACGKYLLAHVRICVLSLLIERVAEIACQQPWSQIRRKLQTLQVTEFLTLKHRFYRRNELTPEVSQTLKALAVAAPKSILAVGNLS